MELAWAGEYVFRRPQSKLPTHHLMIHQCTNSTIPNFRSHSLLPRFHGSRQLCGSSWPGSIISAHPLPTLLEPQPFIRIHSFWIAATGVAQCWWWAIFRLAPPFHHTVLNRHKFSIFTVLVLGCCQHHKSDRWKFPRIPDSMLFLILDLYEEKDNQDSHIQMVYLLEHLLIPTEDHDLEWQVS